MRWKETAHISLLSAGCSCETRLRVACRRTAALSRLLSHRARHDDSLHIHPFHPRRRERGERLMALRAFSLMSA